MGNKKNLFLSIVLFFVFLVSLLFIIACDNLVPSNKPTKYIITAKAGNNGEIIPEGEVILIEGQSQSFTITPDEGYKISDVLVDGILLAVGSEYTFSDVKENHSIQVIFQKIPQPVPPVTIKTFTITSIAETGGAIDPEGNIKVNKGDSQTFSINPDEGFIISDVLVDGESVGVVSEYTIENIQANHTIQASFIQQFTITASAGDNGSIEPVGEIIALQGENKTFTITPDICYQIEKILINDEEVEIKSPYTITNIGQDYNIIVSFASSEKKIRRYNQAGELQNDDYTSIQTAIDDSLDGDTLIVCPGAYNENIKFDNKNITLSSIDPEDHDIVVTTVIDGDEDGSVVSFINGSESALQGFTIICGTGTMVGGYAAGGGVYIDNSNPKVSYNVIENNQATHGGGIYLMESPSSIIEKNIIRKNMANNKGGGIYAYISSPNIIRNTINENSTGNGSTADEFGGGMYIFRGYTESQNGISDNTIDNNEANYDGGGIYLSETSPEINNNHIQSNSANKNGGGICIKNNSSPNITNNNVITANSAGQNGGGIYIEYSYGNTENSINWNIIEDNIATFSGGGFYILDSSPVICDNTIGSNLNDKGNTAKWGGAICIISSVNNTYLATISSNNIKNNKATSFGGGIFVNPNSMLLPDTIRPDGWGKSGDGEYRENIPFLEASSGELIPLAEVEYNIASNVFLGNKHGDLLDYSEGAHVYFSP